MSKALQQFRTVAFVEGVSYLVLLFVAMPMKYMLGIAMAVKIVGWAHGVLFMAYIALGLRAAYKHKWTLAFALVAFIASLVPFGTFWLDGRLKT